MALSFKPKLANTKTAAQIIAESKGQDAEVKKLTQINLEARGEDAGQPAAKVSPNLRDSVAARLSRIAQGSTGEGAASQPAHTPNENGSQQLKTPSNSILGKMKVLQQASENMKSVFPEEPWPESYIEDFDADRHLDDLKALEVSLTEDVPGLPALMGRVMKNLRNYPDLAHLLNEAQIQCVVKSFCKRKMIEIVTPTKGGAKGGKGVSVANLTKDLNAKQILDML